MSSVIQFDEDELRPLIRLAVTEVLEQVESERAKFSGRLAYPEAKAAALLG
jgi:hypothetical protein